MENLSGRSAMVVYAGTAHTPGVGLVRDWMTSPARAVRPETTYLAAFAQMMDAHIQRLPVVDHEKLVGVITRADIEQAHPTLPVRQILKPAAPLAVTPETTIARAAALMLDHQIDGLPVVDGAGRLVGIITQTDLVRVLVGQARTEEWP
jgi:acetoin utilization protein AcuB